MRRLLLVLGAVCAAALPAASPGRTQARATTIAVTITSSQLRLSQAPVRVGLVVFRVENRARVARDFRFGAKRTPKLAPGKSATLTVRVVKTGLALYSSTGPPGSVPLSGVLTFVDPCTSPTTSTVTVQMKEASPALSPTRVACGTVTFVVTNAGTIPHSLTVGSTDGPALQPGETGRLTVLLTSKGRVFYRCGQPEHDELYGETGWVTVV